MLKKFYDVWELQAQRFLADVLESQNSKKKSISRAELASLLKALQGYSIEAAYAEVDWYFSEKGKRKIDFKSFLERFKSKGALLHRFEVYQNVLQQSDCILPYNQIKFPIKSINLTVPDSEASVLTDFSGCSGEKGAVFSEYEGSVFRYNRTWMKKWSKRWLVVDYGGIRYSKRRENYRDVKAIALGQILDVSAVVAPQNYSKAKLKSGSFQIHTTDKRVHIFAPESEGISVEQWCSVISSYVLIHAVQHNLSLARVKHFVEIGANINISLREGKQYPALALAISCRAYDVAEYLLRRGANPSCLLRWKFLMEDRLMSPEKVLALLLKTKQDLNVCGDDSHRWTLLHYLAYTGLLTEVIQVLERVDDQSVHALNTLGDCPLMISLKAEKSDKFQEISLILAERSDLSCKDRNGETPLHLAIKRRYTNLVYYILEQSTRCDLNARDCEGNTALHLALKTRQFEIAEKLVLQDRCDLNLQDHSCKDTAFTLSLKAYNPDFALLLLHQGACYRGAPTNWNLQKCESDTNLHVAIKLGFKELAEQMVINMSDLDDLAVFDTEGRTALHLAMDNHYFRLCYTIVSKLKDEKFLEMGETIINTPDATAAGEAPLLLALRLGLPELACVLLDNGASPVVRSRFGVNCIHMTVQLVKQYKNSPYRHQTILGFLESQLDLHEAIGAVQDEIVNQAPLHVAISCGEIAAARMLLKKNPTLVNKPDEEGNSMICHAVKHNSLEMCRLALESGSSLNIVNCFGDSVMHLAVKSSSEQILGLLLQEGAYLGHWDSNGDCPIHIATRSNNHKFVNIFAQCCKQLGHLELRNEDGYTPIMLAVSCCSTDSAKILINHNVDLRSQIPKTREGLLQIAALRCKADATSFVMSGMASLILNLNPEMLLLQGLECASVPHASSLCEIRAFISNAVESMSRREGSENIPVSKSVDTIPVNLKQHANQPAPEHAICRFHYSNTKNYQKVMPKLCEEKLNSMVLPANEDNGSQVISDEHSLCKNSIELLTKLSKNKKFLPPVVENLILKKIKAEAKETAEAWLATNAGKLLLVKQVQAFERNDAQNLQKNDSGVFEHVRDAFIQAHIQSCIETFHKLRQQDQLQAYAINTVEEEEKY